MNNHSAKLECCLIRFYVPSELMYILNQCMLLFLSKLQRNGSGVAPFLIKTNYPLAKYLCLRFIILDSAFLEVLSSEGEMFSSRDI